MSAARKSPASADIFEEQRRASLICNMAIRDGFFLKKNFTPMIVPSLVRRENLLGTGYIPQGEEDLYKTQDGEYLAGTAEVATMGYYMDEVIPTAELPKRFLPSRRVSGAKRGAMAKM